ncbi:hypothetical protein ABZP36_027192 [Zizania latifolia]
MDNLSPIPEENGEDAGVVGNDNSSAPPPPSLGELAAPVPPLEGGMSRTPDFPGNSLGQGWSLSDIIGVPAAHGLDFAVQGDGDMPSLDEENEEDLFSMFVDFGKVNSAGVGSSTSTHQRSHSMDASSSMAGAGALPPRAPRHQRSHSMHVPRCSLQAQHGSPAAAGIANSERKQLSEAELAQLAVVDPKRAQRIVANRQSAARAKERKMQYTAALEQKVKALEEELASLAAQLAHFQIANRSPIVIPIQTRNNLLQAENNELKMNMQNVEINDQLKSALNDILASEIKNLRIEPIQIGSGGVAMNFGGQPQPFRGDQQMLDNQTMQQMLDENQAMQQILDENQALMQQMLGQNQALMHQMLGQNQTMNMPQGMEQMQVSPPLLELPQSLDPQPFHPFSMEDQQLLQTYLPNPEMDEPVMDGFNHGQMRDDGSENNNN